MNLQNPHIVHIPLVSIDLTRSFFKLLKFIADINILNNPLQKYSELFMYHFLISLDNTSFPSAISGQVGSSS